MTEGRRFTKAEVGRLNDKRNVHVVIHGKAVYDLHKFILEHPGGDLVILGEAGSDATESWEDVGHSDEARKMMERFMVGTCPELEPTVTTQVQPKPKTRSRSILPTLASTLIIPVVLYWLYIEFISSAT